MGQSFLWNAGNGTEKCVHKLDRETVLADLEWWRILHQISKKIELSLSCKNIIVGRHSDEKHVNSILAESWEKGEIGTAQISARSAEDVSLTEIRKLGASLKHHGLSCEISCFPQRRHVFLGVDKSIRSLYWHVNNFSNRLSTWRNTTWLNWGPGKGKILNANNLISGTT
jgi:hypothetical protein